MVNTFTVDELERIFRDYGEEPQARRIAERSLPSERSDPSKAPMSWLRLVAAGQGRSVDATIIRRPKYFRRCESR